jgi:hypothetical protein
VLAFLSFGVAIDAHALEIEKLVMPGPVISGHAKFEADCRNCHVAFAKTEQNTLCLDCHKDVARDLRTGAGYHGKSPNVSKAGCVSCHTDHQGREADIVHLDKDTFNHRFTDFPLRGTHQGVACNDCHIPEKLFREAETQCIACHKDDDSHKGNLGDRCASCHNEQNWLAAVTTFDHAESTGYPLLGGHADVSCGACHADQTFKSTPTACVDCHRSDDVHTGTNGSTAKAATAFDVENLDFDHARKRASTPRTRRHRLCRLPHQRRPHGAGRDRLHWLPRQRRLPPGTQWRRLCRLPRSRRVVRSDL